MHGSLSLGQQVGRVGFFRLQKCPSYVLRGPAILFCLVQRAGANFFTKIRQEFAKIPFVLFFGNVCQNRKNSFRQKQKIGPFEGSPGTLQPFFKTLCPTTNPPVGVHLFVQNSMSNVQQPFPRSVYVPTS